ncbi:MAG: murein peptide amidase A, partial [Bdellovibrionales bacterium]|nr:murein peptide amidase A [Bdellovibrionales bacterium]
MNTFYDTRWSLSFEKRPIELWASSESALNGDSQPLLMIGGVHGDEPEGVELAKKTLDWLKSESYQKHSPPNKEWILIPCINPDGYLKNQRTNAQGIDLNRNFPTENWSSAFEKERYCPGKFPMESPEVKSLVDLILKSQPEVIFHFHSWNPCIVIKGPK